jgi:hypothetical protein
MFLMLDIMKRTKKTYLHLNNSSYKLNSVLVFKIYLMRIFILFAENN